MYTHPHIVQYMFLTYANIIVVTYTVQRSRLKRRHITLTYLSTLISVL